MADRFPLIVNQNSRRIEELASGDNLNLSYNGIIANNSLGEPGQFLQYDGTKILWAFPENTVTKIKAGNAGTFFSGNITFLEGPSGNITIEQNGGTFTIDSINNVTRFRGTEFGTYVDGDITITGTGNTNITQSGRTIIVDSDFTQVKSDWNAINSVAEILNKPFVPKVPVIDIVPASGSGNLTYDSFTGVFTFTPADFSGLATNENQTNWDTAYSWGDHAAVGYLTSPAFPQRESVQVTTSSIANDVAAEVQVLAGKSYLLQKIQTSAAAWVTVYSDITSRNDDTLRNEFTDPLPGTGVIAEVITTGAVTQKLTPAVIGWNDDVTPTENIYLKVVNKSGITQPITVTITYVKLEG